MSELIGYLSEVEQLNGTLSDPGQLVGNLSLPVAIGGLSEEVKQALLDLFQHLAYTDADGQDYYDALYDALYPPAELVRITAVYTQTSTVYPDTPLDDLKDDLVVTAHYSDGTSEAVTTYTLSGTLTAGASTVTVTYEDKTTTFTVTVSAPAVLSSISAVYTQSGVVYPTDSLDSLKPDLVVTAHYSDSSTATVTTYTLSGSLTVGTSTITVTYSGKTTTFNVTVTAVPVLDSITAVYTQSGTVYDTDSLDSLKADLVVTAVYTDSSTEVVPSTDYTLSGTLTAGTSTITVSYEGETATFSVTVTASGTTILGYVGENIIMLLDGIANGTGGTHETTITTLADQSGNGYDWVAKAGTVTADNTALIFNGSASFEGNSTWKTGALTTPKTVEIVVDVTTPSTTQCVINGVTVQQSTTSETPVGAISVKSGNILNHTGSTYGCVPITSGVHTYSFVNNNGSWSAYKDGTAVTNSSTTATWKSGYKSLGAFIGSGGTPPQYFFTGKVYSYRIYSEPLSADQIASNRANDVTRFSLT